MNSNLDLAMINLQSLVDERLRTMMDYLTTKGLSELDAINLILDVGESILDEMPVQPKPDENQPFLPGIFL